jgi:hypothetical protein
MMAIGHRKGKRKDSAGSDDTASRSHNVTTMLISWPLMHTLYLGYIKRADDIGTPTLIVPWIALR